MKELKSIKKEIKRLEKEETIRENQIKSVIGEYEGLKTVAGVAKWSSTSYKKFDTKKFSLEEPQLYDKLFVKYNQDVIKRPLYIK